MGTGEARRGRGPLAGARAAPVGCITDIPADANSELLMRSPGYGNFVPSLVYYGRKLPCMIMIMIMAITRRRRSAATSCMIDLPSSVNQTLP